MENKKLLIAEDSEDFQEMLSDLFSQKGYETLVVSNGLQALDTALSEHPDLILLDVRMPEMDGFDVLRKLREDDWGKTVKVLLLTLAGTPDIVPEDIDFDKNDFLMKTKFGLENIAERVEKEMSE